MFVFTGRLGWTIDDVRRGPARADRSRLLGHRLRTRAFARRLHEHSEVCALDRQGHELRNEGRG